MLLLVVLVGMGEKMAERFLPLYILALGGGAWAVGALNAMDNLLSALYSFPGGWLADRIGHKRSLELFTLVALAGYLLVILVPDWRMVLAGSVLFISWTAVSLPAIMSLVSKAAPKDRRSLGVSLHSFTRRVPMALGPLAGGLLINAYGKVQGTRAAFCAAFAMGLAGLVATRLLMAEDAGAGPAAPGGRRPLRELFSPALRSLLASDILIRFAEQIPYAFVVVWAVNENGLTAFQFGILTAIEMAVAMLVYIPVAWLADRRGKKPFVLATFGFFTLFPLVLLASRSFTMFILAFVVRGLKEFGEPTRKALIMDLAPEDAKARAFGAYYLVRDLVVSAAALSSAWLWKISPAANFLVAAGFGALGTALFAAFGRDLPVAGAAPGSES